MIDEKPIIVRGSDGRFLPGTVAPRTIKTPEDARNLALVRWEKARKATANRITLEAMSIDPTVKDEYDAHALMMAKQYTTVLDSDKPRMDDAEKVAQAMGTAPRNAELRTESQVGTMPDDDTMRQLARFAAEIAAQMSRPVVDVIPMRNEIETDTE